MITYITKPIKSDANRVLISMTEGNSEFVVGKVYLEDNELILESAKEGDIKIERESNFISIEHYPFPDKYKKLVDYVFNNIAVESFQDEVEAVITDDVDEELREFTKLADSERKPIFIKTPFGIMGIFNLSGDYYEIKFVLRKP